MRFLFVNLLWFSSLESTSSYFCLPNSHSQKQKSNSSIIWVYLAPKCLILLAGSLCRCPIKLIQKSDRWDENSSERSGSSVCWQLLCIFKQAKTLFAFLFCLEMVHKENNIIKFKVTFTHLGMLWIQMFRALPFWSKHWLSIKIHFYFFLFSKWTGKSVLYYSNSFLQQKNAGKCATEWSQNTNVVMCSA